MSKSTKKPQTAREAEDAEAADAHATKRWPFKRKGTFWSRMLRAEANVSFLAGVRWARRQKEKPRG